MVKCVVGLLLLAAMGCTSSQGSNAVTPAAGNAERTDVQTASEGTAPEREHATAKDDSAPRPEPPASRVVELAVDGFSPAVLVLPDDLGSRRPVLIATHGAGDGPEWQCETWQGIVRGRGFILCPRGVRLTADPKVTSGYFYRNHLELEREVLAAVEALERAYAREVDASAVVYTGYSQGATMGVLMLIQHAALFPRLILVEGGHQDWSPRMAKQYKEKGGLRVLLACGGAHCNNNARRSAKWLDAEGVVARAEYVVGAGHTYGGPVA
ncbi:MAG TPA: hypothetical protein VK524_22200, partial [Polyangiaceae bacterium]|nr:hypothetical protein [Polyangiaceae bacterium]